MVGQARRHHRVRRPTHLLVRDVLPPAVPRVPAERRREADRIPHLEREALLRLAARVLRRERKRVVAGLRHRAAEQTRRRVERRPFGQPLHRELHRPLARNRQPIQNRTARPYAEHRRTVDARRGRFGRRKDAELAAQERVAPLHAGLEHERRVRPVGMVARVAVARVGHLERHPLRAGEIGIQRHTRAGAQHARIGSNAIIRQHEEPHRRAGTILHVVIHAHVRRKARGRSVRKELVLERRMDAQSPVKNLARERDRTALHGMPRTRRTPRAARRVREVHRVKIRGARRHVNRRVHLRFLRLDKAVTEVNCPLPNWLAECDCETVRLHAMRILDQLLAYVPFAALRRNRHVERRLSAPQREMRLVRAHHRLLLGDERALECRRLGELHLVPHRNLIRLSVEHDRAHELHDRHLRRIGAGKVVDDRVAVDRELGLQHFRAERGASPLQAPAHARDGMSVGVQYLRFVPPLRERPPRIVLVAGIARELARADVDHVASRVVVVVPVAVRAALDGKGEMPVTRDQHARAIEPVTQRERFAGGRLTRLELELPKGTEAVHPELARERRHRTDLVRIQVGPRLVDERQQTTRGRAVAIGEWRRGFRIHAVARAKTGHDLRARKRCAEVHTPVRGRAHLARQLHEVAEAEVPVIHPLLAETVGTESREEARRHQAFRRLDRLGADERIVLDREDGSDAAVVADGAPVEAVRHPPVAIRRCSARAA